MGSDLTGAVTISVDEFVVADSPESWTDAGFSVDPDSTCRVGSVRIRLVGRDHGLGIVGWSLRGLPGAGADLDGVPTTSSTDPPTSPSAHPNGVVAIDHVVLASPDLDRTVASFAGIGVAPRRERAGVLGGQSIRQVFFRLGEVVVEAIGAPDTATAGPSGFWGMTYVVTDLDQTAAFFGERIGRVKDAVQPGRRIATLRHRDLGLSVRTALISPPAVR